MRKNLIRIAAFLVGVILFGGIAYALTAPFLQNKPTVLVEVNYTGGLCSTGKVCNITEKIYTNGKYTSHPKLSSGQIERITQEIEKSDLNSLKPNREPDCPSFVDGQDVSFIFPDKYGDQKFTLCQIENYKTVPLFSYLLSII